MNGPWRFTSFVLVLAAGILSLQFAGCGYRRPKRVPVSGQVLVDGKPLAAPAKGYAYVRLVPSGDRPATGNLDSEGRFTLTTFDGEDGSVLGTHKVVVAAYEQIGPAACRWLAPKKYADFKTTDKTVTIDEETDSLKIELSWEGKQPLVERFDVSGDADPSKLE